MPCLKLNLGLCNLSYPFVQFHFNRFRAKHQDVFETCDLETTNILMEIDVSLPLAECNLNFADQLLTSVQIYPTWPEAMCSSFYAHSSCMKGVEIPFLLKYLMSRHDKFYSDFWARSCVNFNPDMSDGGDTTIGM